MNIKNVKYRVTKSGCYIVTSHARKSDGIIRVIIDGRSESLHRWVYSHNVRPLSKFEFIKHTCGEKSCINPKHMIARTRFPRSGNHLGNKEALTKIWF